MKNFLQNKKINLTVLLLSVFAAASIYGYFYLGYCIDNCSTELIRGYLNPLYNFFFGLAAIAAFFLVLPVRYFKTWFKFILPVAVVLIFLHASNVSVYSSSILSMSRAEVVRFDMFLLGVVSVIYVIVMFARGRLKKKHATKS